MIIDWFKSTIIEGEIPDFKCTNIKEIKCINYYNDYNEFYDDISFLIIKFILDNNNNRYILSMKFNEISSLYLTDLGGGSNQMMGFRIEDLVGRGFEKSERYFVEDYENETIKFNCSAFEVISLEEI